MIFIRLTSTSTSGGTYFENLAEKEASFQANLSDFYDTLIAKNRQNGK